MSDIVKFFSDMEQFGDSVDCLQFLVSLIPSWIMVFLGVGCLVAILIGIIKLVIELL